MEWIYIQSKMMGSVFSLVSPGSNEEQEEFTIFVTAGSPFSSIPCLNMYIHNKYRIAVNFRGRKLLRIRRK